MSATSEVWSVDRIEHAVLPLLVTLDARDRIVHISLGARSEALTVFACRHRARLRVEIRTTRVRRRLLAYLGDDPGELDLPLRPLGTGFQQRAWRALRAIPRSETRTYGQQAAMLGDPGAARAVGRANAVNPIPIVIPCHRVVGHDGSLTGFGGGLAAKRWLLDLEGRQGTFPALLAGAGERGEVVARA